LYDPVAGMWSPTGSLSTARSGHTATLLPNGKVLVTGGLEGGPGGLYYSVAASELYDPAAGTWSPTGSLSTARSGHTATLLPNGNVLVAGGDFVSSPNPFYVIAASELYDPAAGTWSPTGSLSTARSGHTATLLPNGTVLVAGGSGTGPIAASELYDPTAGTWSPTGSLSTARSSGYTATLLPNGKVLVAGGWGGTGPIAASELYDPAAGTWSPTGSLSAARDFHTATLLPSGVVLVAAGAILASAELYW
jgi:galactose oxidase-like protein